MLKPRDLERAEWQGLQGYICRGGIVDSHVSTKSVQRSSSPSIYTILQETVRRSRQGWPGWEGLGRLLACGRVNDRI
jgi:hypothetical protein